MARRYARDNRGRFSSTGATARGGRLRTASGKKRETVKASPGAADKLSSTPKGTVGKIIKQREVQRLDRSGEKRPAFNEAYKSQRAASRAAKAAPKEMSIEEFARKTGGKTRADAMSQAIEASRQPKGRTKAGDRRVAAARDKINAEVNATTSAYNKAVARGEIKAPTTSLARKAQGEPSNPAVQAAQRLLAKTAAKRAEKSATTPQAKPLSRSRRRPTAAESRAKGLTPISDIRARQAAAGAAADATRTRRVQSNISRDRAQKVLAANGKQRAPFGRYSTIKNPAQEGSFPQMAPGRSGMGMAQAAKGRTASVKPAKSESQVLQQADRVMSKLAKRQAAVQVDKVGLNEGLRQVRRNNARAGRVNSALASRGLLGKYQKLTAGADPIRMTSAGKGIKNASKKKR